MDAEKEKRLRQYLMNGRSDGMAKGGIAELPEIPGLATSPAEGGLPPEPPSDSDVLRDEKIEPSDPGLQLSNYIKAEQAKTSKYGAADQAKVMEGIDKESNSWGNTIGRMGTGFADAIMQGVAQAGNPGFKKQFDDNLNTRLNRKAEVLPKLQKMNLEEMDAQRKLEGMTSSSALGSSYVDSLKPIAQKIFPDLTEAQWEKISRNPAALQSMLGPSVDMKKVEGELAIRDAVLASQDANYKKKLANDAETLRLQKEKEQREAEDKKRDDQRDAAKAVLDRDKKTKVLGVPIPFTNPVSGKESKEAQKVLADQMTSVIPVISSDEAYSALPKGATYKTASGKTKIKS